MGRVIHLRGDEHEEAQALLPWYAAGRLDEDDRAMVEAHLGACAQCDEELKVERWLSTRIATAAPAGPDEAEIGGAWRRVSALMQQDDAARSAPASTVRARPRPSWLGWSIAAQVCWAAMLGVLVWRSLPPAQYHALAAPARPAAGNVVAIFAPDTSEATFRAILRDSHAQLVGGPTAAAAYLLRVPAAERAATLRSLRGRREVVMAEPVDGSAPK